MASLLILAGAMIHDRVKERKDAKRRKINEDERKHRQLQAESERRAKKAGVERNYDSEDEKDDEPLPRYEDVAGNGEGSSNGGTAEGQSASDPPPPDYRRPLVETRRHPGVEFSPNIL